jgi:hypothetical protein
MSFALRVSAASVVLLLLYGGIHPTFHDAISAVPSCAILGWIAFRSRASGADLIASLAGLYFLVVSLATIPEAVLFGFVKAAQAPLFMAEQLGIAFVIAAVIAVLFGKTDAAPLPAFRPLSLNDLAWRLTAGILVFTACYAYAGMAVYPAVKSFWLDKTLPDMEAILGLQVLRSVVLMGAAAIAVRGMPKRGEAMLLVAIAFPVLGALCLEYPDGMEIAMPANIVVAHIAEVVPYFALCGFLYAWWFYPTVEETEKNPLPSEATAS